MALIKPKYTGRNGKTCTSSKWYVQFRDAQDIRRRLPAFPTRKHSESLERCLQELVMCKQSRQLLPPEIVRWLDELPSNIREKLIKWRLIEGHSSTGKTLLQHIEDWQKSLEDRGNTDHHCKLVSGRVRRLIEGCAFAYHSDIKAADVASWLAERRREGLSIQSSNFYLQNVKQFCKWLCREGKAASSPVEYLQGQNVRTDRRHDRRALSDEEVKALLDAASTGKTIKGMSGVERSLVYRLALSTGLRRSEIASLTRESFRLDNGQATVTILAGQAKNRREDTLPLQEDIANDLSDLLANLPPKVPVFNIPKHDSMSKLVKADLEEARKRWMSVADDDQAKEERQSSDFLRYSDSARRVADFHALRHTFGTRLAAAGVSPRVSQSLMRHSDIALTMNRYTHVDAQQEAEAVAKLPSYGAKVKLCKGDGAGTV